MDDLSPPPVKGIAKNQIHSFSENRHCRWYVFFMHEYCRPRTPHYELLKHVNRVMNKQFGGELKNFKVTVVEINLKYKETQWFIHHFTSLCTSGHATKQPNLVLMVFFLAEETDFKVSSNRLIEFWVTDIIFIETSICMFESSGQTTSSKNNTISKRSMHVFLIFIFIVWF